MQIIRIIFKISCKKRFYCKFCATKGRAKPPSCDVLRCVERSRNKRSRSKRSRRAMSWAQSKGCLSYAGSDVLSDVEMQPKLFNFNGLW